MKIFMGSQKLILIGLMLLISFATLQATIEPNTYYEVSLEYSENQISIKNIEIIIDYREPGNFPGDLISQVLDSKGEVLEEINFEIQNILIYDTIDPETGEIAGGGTEDVSEGEFIIYLPYDKHGTEIKILNEKGDKILSKDVSYYSETNVVDSPEKIESGEDPSERETSARRYTEEKGSFKDVLSDNSWVLILIFVGLLVIFIYFLNKKPTNKL